MTTRSTVTSSWDAIRENEGLPRMSEPELLHGKGYERAERCACGTVLIAGPGEAESVCREHVGSPRHLAWRAWRETV